MKKFECIKPLIIDQYDEHCCWTGEQKVIEIGTLWNVEEDLVQNFIADKEALHLTLETNDPYKCEWIELFPDTINAHFKQVI